jgi:hypothetical protein
MYFIFTKKKKKKKKEDQVSFLSYNIKGTCLAHGFWLLVLTLIAWLE